MNTFSQALKSAYQQAPDQVAIRLLFNRQPEKILTYAGLLAGANSYARALAAAGVQPGEVVILILPHGEDLPLAFFGTILRGAIPSIMPYLTEKLSPEHYRRSLRSLFEITAPAAVITYPDFTADAIQASAGASVRAVLTTTDRPTASLPSFEAGSEELVVFKGLEAQPVEIVLLQHSSGTTGLQKGVALSHQAVFNQLAAYSKALRLDSKDVVVSWLPLYHDMGLIAGFLLPILSRIPLVLLSPLEWVRAPYRLLQAISQYHGTLCWLPNFAYNFCAQKIRARDLEGVDLSSLRALINCSEPMHWKSQRVFYERFEPYGFRAEALATCYAMAENVFAVTQGGIETLVTVDLVDPAALSTRQVAEPAQAGSPAISMLSAGKPIDQTSVCILDPEGQALTDRRVGEIAIQSNCMLSGYYHRPDLTQEAFREGWYLTGDLGYMANGEVYITGRKKDLIIVGGKNVFPQDLERLAGEVEGVHPGRVVAFGVFDEELGTEEVVIVAELDHYPSEMAFQIGEEIRRRVNTGSDVALRYVHCVGRNWLLKTSSGKIARSANREKYLAERLNPES